MIVYCTGTGFTDIKGIYYRVHLVAAVIAAGFHFNFHMEFN